MDRGAWRATVCEISESDTTQLKQQLEKPHVCRNQSLDLEHVRVGWGL